MINDPWAHPYIYRIPGEHGDYDLYSLGADNAVGGQGENQDITNW
jgi:general secretion pathway protein G